MSTRRSIGVLILISSLTITGVTYVHTDQKKGRERMHRAVLRDLEEEERIKKCAEDGGPCGMVPTLSSSKTIR